MAIRQEKVEIISISRVWAKAKINNYNCKLKVCAHIKELGAGIHELTLNDISVRSKYGTDLRFEIASESKEKVFLKTKYYNSILVEKCRELGGIWDGEEKVWVFSDLVSDQVEKLEEIYNSEEASIEMKFEYDYRSPQSAVDFKGFTICTAFGRDSGAKLSENISMIKGKIDSSGSMKNWYTTVENGTIFRFKVPSAILKDFSEWDEVATIKVI